MTIPSKAQYLVNKFNSTFPAGSPVLWRPNIHEDFTAHTVALPAKVNHDGTPVTWLAGVRAPQPIFEENVAYDLIPGDGPPEQTDEPAPDENTIIAKAKTAMFAKTKPFDIGGAFDAGVNAMKALVPSAEPSLQERIDKQEELVSALWDFAAGLQNNKHDCTRGDYVSVHLGSVEKARLQIMEIFGVETVEIS